MTPDVDETWIRALPSLTGVAPTLDAAALPDDPLPLFRQWIAQAEDAGVAEPHAMTLATVDAEGMPDARTVILKGVDADGWAFAGRLRSRKGDQLAAHPVAALNFWWQPVLRAVRVRGGVVEAPPEEVAADLAARSTSARATIAPEEWMRWRLRPTRIEFWQGAVDRRHSRIVYERSGDAWTRAVSGTAAG